MISLIILYTANSFFSKNVDISFILLFKAFMKTVLTSVQKNYEVLLNELILVNYNDQFVSGVDKWTAHTNQYLK